MHIKIGPYINWIGPYQIADILQKFGFSEDTCDKIGEYLSKTYLNDICEWIYDKRKRTVKVKIHKYDTWNVDVTLSIIILPLLKQLQESKHGSPQTDDEDVPEELRSTNAPPKVYDYDIDDNFHKRWDWIMNEMIWAFEQLQPDNDWESQYHKGNIDVKFEKCPDKEYSKMVYGENHTSTWDKEGLEKHSKRIEKGLILFGKYYRGLWD